MNRMIVTERAGRRKPAAAHAPPGGPGARDWVIGSFDFVMARPLRVEFAGAVYRVIMRENERKAVFRDDNPGSIVSSRKARARSAGFGLAPHGQDRPGDGEGNEVVPRVY